MISEFPAVQPQVNADSNSIFSAMSPTFYRMFCSLKSQFIAFHLPLTYLISVEAIHWQFRSERDIVSHRLSSIAKSIKT